MKQKGDGMFEELIGKKVILKVSDGGGTVEHYNLQVLRAEGCLVTVQGNDGKIRVVNMSSPPNMEMKEQ